jgi:predicted small metal-binding protein
MRVIDCDCGRTVQAVNDDELFEAVREHIDADHPEMELDDAKVRDLIAAKAYEATDA